MLAGAKRVEVQSTQAVVLNTLTNSKQFDKVKISKKARWQTQTSSKPDHTVRAMQVLWGNPPANAVPSIQHDVCKVGHFRKVCQSRRSKVVNEMEQEVWVQQRWDWNGECQLCIHEQKLIDAYHQVRYAASNKITILYKIDTGSDSNIMPWYIFKKLFPRVTEAELAKTGKNHIQVKLYNKPVIT